MLYSNRLMNLLIFEYFESDFYTIFCFLLPERSKRLSTTVSSTKEKKKTSTKSINWNRMAGSIEQYSASIAIACIIGSALSVYSYYLNSRLEEDDEYEALCDLGERLSCTKSLQSEYVYCNKIFCCGPFQFAFTWIKLTPFSFALRVCSIYFLSFTLQLCSWLWRRCTITR